MKSAVSVLAAGGCLLTWAAFAQEPQPASIPPNPASGTTSEPTSPHHPDENSQLLQEWAPPSDEVHASGSGDARGFLGHYLSTKPISDVWKYYATKLGMTPIPATEAPYRADFYTQQFPKVGPRPADGRATLTIKNVQFPDQAERSATLIRREPNGKTTTVFLASQGERTIAVVMIVPDR